MTVILFAVLIFFCVYSGWANTINKNAEHFLYHHPSATSDRIKIIKNDKKSISALGDYADWERVFMPIWWKHCVFSKIEDIRLAVITFDVLFDSGGETEEDRRFAKFCKENINVVCAFNYVFKRDLVINNADGVLKLII